MNARLLTYRLAAAAALIALLAMPAVSAAQPGDGDQARHGEMLIVGVTHEWQRAYDQSRRSGNSEARARLIQARSLLDRARMELRKRNYAAAKTSAEAARTIIRGYEHGPNANDAITERRLGDAEAMLGRLRQLGPMGPRGRQVEQLIAQARGRGQDGIQPGAEHLAEMAERQSILAWRDAMQSQTMRQRTVVLEAIVEPLVERAGRLARSRDDEHMVAVANRAHEHVSLSRQLDANTQAPQKARLLQAAMREADLVLRTLDEAEYQRRHARRAVEQAEAALGRASDVVDDESSSDRGDLIEQGRAILLRAREKLDGGEMTAAMRLAENARDIARRIIGEALGQLSEASVTSAIERTDQFLTAAAGVGGDRALSLLGAAQSHQAQARRLLQEGSLRQALARTRIAARLAQRAREQDH